MRRIATVLATAAVLTILACLAGPAPADTLTLKDGRKLEGRLLSRGDDQISFQVVQGGSSTVMTFRTADVEKLTEGPLATASRPASQPTSKSLLDLPPAPAAPPVVKYTGPTYYLIPLHGRVGQTVLAELLEKSLADAAKRGPTVVILEVDSPGGLIQEVPKIADVIRKYSKQLRVAVYVRKSAISAAAILSMSAGEIYMNPGAIIGAATAFQMDPNGTPADISEKFQSIWRATARSAAEQGGHSGLLAEGMIDAKLELFLAQEGGKKIVKEGKGAEVVKRPGRLLAMTAGEALSCGLSAGTVEGYEDLGKLLKLPGWTECKGLGVPLFEHWEQTTKAVSAAAKKLQDEFTDNMRQAAEIDPTRFTYKVNASEQFTSESRQKWQERSGACARFLARAETNLKDAAALAAQYPQLSGDPETVKEVMAKYEKQVEVIRKRIVEGTFRKGARNE